MMTRLPSLANRSAAARPMPVLEPVMRMTLPFSSFMLTGLLTQRIKTADLDEARAQSQWPSRSNVIAAFRHSGHTWRPLVSSSVESSATTSEWSGSGKNSTENRRSP